MRAFALISLADPILILLAIIAIVVGLVARFGFQRSAFNWGCGVIVIPTAIVGICGFLMKSCGNDEPKHSIRTVAGIKDPSAGHFTIEHAWSEADTKIVVDHIERYETTSLKIVDEVIEVKLRRYKKADETIYGNRHQNLDFLKDLEGLSSLTRLTINDCKELKSIKGLNALQSLEFLEIFNSRVPEDFAHLELPSLKKLQLKACKGGEAINLPLLPELEMLDVIGCGLKAFDPSSCPALTRVKLWSNFHLEQVKISGLRQLQDLNIASCDALQTLVLKDIENLQSLSLSGSRRLDLADTLKQVSSLHSLTQLQIEDSELLTDIDPLRALTNLRVLGLYRCHALKNVDGLMGLPQLEWVEFLDCKGLPSDTEETLKKWHPNIKFGRPSDLEAFLNRSSNQ